MTVFLSTTLLWLPEWSTVNYINLSHSGVEVIQTTFIYRNTRTYQGKAYSNTKAQKVPSNVRRGDHLQPWPRDNQSFNSCRSSKIGPDFPTDPWVQPMNANYSERLHELCNTPNSADKSACCLLTCCKYERKTCLCLPFAPLITTRAEIWEDFPAWAQISSRSSWKPDIWRLKTKTGRLRLKLYDLVKSNPRKTFKEQKSQRRVLADTTQYRITFKQTTPIR